MFVNHIHIGMQRPGSNLAILFLCFKHTPFNSLQYTGAFGNCIHADKRLSETDSLITLVLTIFYFGNPNSASLGYFLLNIRHSVNRIDRKYYELLKSNIDFEGAHGNLNTEQKRQKISETDDNTNRRLFYLTGNSLLITYSQGCVYLETSSSGKFARVLKGLEASTA